MLKLFTRWKIFYIWIKSSCLRNNTSKATKSQFDILLSEDECLDRSLIELEKNNYNAAFKLIAQSLAISPSSFFSLYYLGYYYQKTMFFDKARDYYMQALCFAPNHLWALIRLSELSRITGDLHHSLNTAKLVIELYNDDPWAWQNYAESLLLLKNHTESLYAFSKSLLLKEDKYTRSMYYKLLNKIQQNTELHSEFYLLQQQKSYAEQNMLKKKLTISALNDVLDHVYINPVEIKSIHNNTDFSFAIFKDTIWLDKYNMGLKKILGCSINSVTNNVLIQNEYDLYCIWGVNDDSTQLDYYQFIKTMNKPALFIEDGFIRSIFPVHKKNIDNISRTSCSYTIDQFSCYYDATRPTGVERFLNSNFILTDKQFKRVNQLIKYMVNNYVTKYNHQPLIDMQITQKHVVLVTDQSYRDLSISRGLADDSSFVEMLNSAIRENPDSLIIVKTHPDSLLNSNKKGYFNENNHQGIIYITQEINPICLLSQIDKVYVVTTQLGFEALMMGKEVVTFGVPFYAGWGLTDDRCKITRRKVKRTLEDIFYAAYIVHSLYYDPESQGRCEIEDVIAFILKYRKIYLGW